MIATLRGLVAFILALGLLACAARAADAPAAGEGMRAHPEWLASADWLARHRGDAAVKVVALTPRSDFEQAHIPGAAQIGWGDLELADTSPASVAAWEASVARKLAELGLQRGDTVVIYDDGTLFAARLWWVLDYFGHEDKRVLDGGLAAWRAAGGPLEAGAPATRPAPVPYPAATNRAALASLEDVRASLGQPGVVLVDARTPGEYAQAHIPGARSVNYPQNALPDVPRLWKADSALRQLYAAAGVTPDHEAIPYCSSGVRSAVAYFTLRLIGYPRVRLFSGSWNEWSRHAELPRRTGNQP